MYLTQKIYVGGEFRHRKVTGKIEWSEGGVAFTYEGGNISEITSQVGYWRKANQIHKWFVENIQEGKDECDTSPVCYKSLVKLKMLCKEVLETKNAELLPPENGFFFGPTEIDDYYWDDLKETIDIINKLAPNGEYFYCSSW